MPTLLTTYLTSTLLLAGQGAFMAAGVSALHLAVPNRMRAQLTAMLLFGTNIVGLMLGPSGVAAITQFGFRDPLALRYALSIVSLSAGSLATLMLWFSWKQFPRLSQRVLNENS
jgi:MFS family permease